MQDKFKAVSGLHMDLVACVGTASKAGTFWRQVKGPHYQAGAWNICWDGSGRFRAQASSEACWLEQLSVAHLLEGLATETRDDARVIAETKVTRVDLCMDVVGLRVRPELELYFTGHRQSHSFHHSAQGATLYIGSRQSCCFLRIYEKYRGPQKVVSINSKVRKAKDAPAHLRAEWESMGWAGEDVTRVEFELKKEGVTRATDERYGRLAAWNDSLARLRMLERPRCEYKQPSTGRTDPSWANLGRPAKAPLPQEPEPSNVAMLLRTKEAMVRRAKRLDISLADLCEAIQYMDAQADMSNDLAKNVKGHAGREPDHRMVMKGGDVIEFTGGKRKPKRDPGDIE